MPPVTLRPDADLREAELRILRRDHDVTGQRELATGPERIPVDGCDHRTGEAARQPGHVLDRLEPEPRLHRRLDGLGLLQVVAGAEGSTPSGQHHDPRVLGGSAAQGRSQRRGQRRGDGVEPIRAVQVDLRDRTVAGVLDLHRVSFDERGLPIDRSVVHHR